MVEPAPEQPPSTRRTRDRLLIAGVIAVGLVLSFVGMRGSWTYRDSVMRRQFSEAAREIENNLSQQAGAVEAFVETVASFFEASREVNREEFESFVSRTASRWPGLASVEWQAWVGRSELAEFEARMRSEGLEGFRVVERDGAGRLVPVSPRDVYLPVVHVHSIGSMPMPPGVDVFANREWVVEKLKEVGASHAVGSPPFGLAAVDGRGAGEGFFVTDAVLKPGTGPAHERIRGFVSAVFAYRPMIQAALEGTGIARLRVKLRDSESDVPIYFSWPAGESEASWSRDGMHAESSVEMAGRTWTISVAPTRELFSGVILAFPWYSLGFGCACTLTAVLVLMWRQRVQAERELQVVERLAVEQRFHDIVDRLSGAVILMRGNVEGTDFEIVDVNESAGQLLGSAREAVIGRRMADVLPQAEGAGVMGMLRRAWRGGDLYRLEALEVPLGGRIRHLSGIFFRVGRGDEICAVLQDLTDLKLAERELRQARDELELALDVSRVGLWSWDTATRQLRVDARCARLYGLPAEGWVEDETVTARIHPDDLKVIRDEVARALSEFRSYEVEYRLTRPDGALRHLCSRARPVREEGAAAKVVGCTWDVTERRHMEEHLRRTQRLESLGTLAGGVAHDLNNALAPVTMGLDLLKRRLGSDQEAIESVKLMQTSVRRASTIVRQLIAFKRGAGESKQTAPAHPKRILEMLGATLVESFPQDISILIEPASLDLPRIVADEREGHQLLLNLCVNARDAMPQGGRLVVSSHLLEIGPDNRGQYPDVRPGTYVAFCVADTGAGIPVDIRHRVFDPFFTTKEVGKGSGLGLSTALGIVRAHRGSIQFDSKDGAGTTFTVMIPALADDEPPKTVPLEVTGAAGHPARRPCLLLVDDEAQVRELSRRALEQAGYKVLTAGNGREGVELFAQDPQGIDAVVMDLLMPVMNGAAATAAIKRLRPEIPILGASGFATDALVNEAKLAGMTTFLPKPFTVTVLVDAVRAAMAGKG